MKKGGAWKKKNGGKDWDWEKGGGGKWKKNKMGYIIKFLHWKTADIVPFSRIK